MSWNTGQIWGFVSFLLNKSQNGNLTQSNFFFAWNSQQRLFQSDMIGHYQSRSNGKEGANTGLIQNEVILTKLSPFTKSVPISIAAGNGNKPTDFIYALALRVNGYECFPIRKGQIPYVNQSVIDPPSVTDNKYYVTEYEGYYSFLPTNIIEAQLDYICEVTDIVYATIPDGNGRPVYDPGSSVNPKWDSNSIIEITQRTLKPFGVHFTSADFENYGNQSIQTGN